MASIHKRPGSKFWHCAFRKPDGCPVFRSTKQTDKTKAMRVCLGYARVTELAKENRATQSQVRNVIDSVLDDLEQKPVNYSAETWFSSWLKDKIASNAPGTAKRYTGVSESFLSFLGSRATHPLETISIEDVRNFRDQQLKKGISAASANLTLKTLRSCLNAAAAQGHLRHNPAQGVALLPPTQKSRGIFTHDQIAAILKAADPEWQLLIQVGYYIGARLGTCAKLRFEDVDFDSATITFVPEKQRRSRTPTSVTVPVHPHLLHLLRTEKKVSGPIFSKLSESRTGGATGLSLSFRALMEKAEIFSSYKSATGKGRKVYSLSFHSLRHTFNSDLANANVRQEIRQKLIGHASASVNDGYTHVEMTTLRDAIAVLPPLPVPITGSCPN